MFESDLKFGPSGANVSELAKSGEFYFLHSFEPNPEHIPYMNSDLRNGSLWPDHVARVLAHKMSVSSFVVQPGDTYSNFYRHTGFIIGDGLAVQGTSADGATGLSKDGTKDFRGSNLAVDIFGVDDIRKIQEGRENSSEVAINYPTPVAWYIADNPQRPIDSKFIDHKQIHELMEDFYGFPVAVWKDGLMYEAVYDHEHEEYVASNIEFRQPDIEKWKQKLDIIRERAIQTILDDSPYDPNRIGTPGYPETAYVSKIEKGKQEYWYTSGCQETLSYSSTEKRRNVNLHLATRQIDEWDMDFDPPKLKKILKAEIIDEDDLGNIIKTSDYRSPNYATSLEYINSRLDALRAMDRIEDRMNACFEIYGAYEEALINNDTDLCSLIDKEIGSILPIDEYINIKDKRLAQGGKLTLYREDFPKNAISTKTF